MLLVRIQRATKLRNVEAQRFLTLCEMNVNRVTRFWANCDGTPDLIVFFVFLLQTIIPTAFRAHRGRSPTIQP
jgi:hypothetical protein